MEGALGLGQQSPTVRTSQTTSGGLGTLCLEGTSGKPAVPSSLHCPPSPLRSSGPTLTLLVMGSSRPRGSSWHPVSRLCFARWRVHSPSLERQQGLPGGRCLGWQDLGLGRQEGADQAVWTLHTHFPATPPALRLRTRRGGSQPHGPACAEHGGGHSVGLFVLHLVFLVWSRARGLGTSGGGGWKRRGPWQGCG